MQKYGTAHIDVDKPVIAGSYQTVRYTYAAEHPIDDSGYIKLVFRFASDFGVPQFTEPEDDNFSAVTTDGDCRIEPRWDPKGHTRPWGKALYLKITGGYLDAGETITVVFGDTGQGSPGWRIQTFCEKTFEFKTFADPYATYRFKELESSPIMEIVPGPPVKAVCIAPSQVKRGEVFTVRLRLEDRWGNAVRPAKVYTQTAPDAETRFTTRVQDEVSGLSAESNPVQTVSGALQQSLWWADFHGQTEETIGSNTIEEYYAYARDCAVLDICAHQGNDFQVTDDFWSKINDASRSFYEPGKFVTFPGYEWSGNTPLGGDRNIYHKTEGGPIYRSSHDLLPDEASVYSPAPTAEELFRLLNPDQSFAFAHVGGRYADTAMHKDGIEVAMEIHSAWGTFEWLVKDALSRGHTIGICANSDGHKCRPGASYPGAGKFGSYGGLTCLLAPSLTRDDIFQALHDRHFFATTGNRPLLSVTAKAGSNGERFMMGDLMAAGNDFLELEVEYYGTAPIDYLEIIDGETILERIFPGAEPVAGNRLKLVWSGAERKGRARQTSWDGHLEVSGNRIVKAAPVNFWNPDQQPDVVHGTLIRWESITTGGAAGLVLDLQEGRKGSLNFYSKQLDCEISAGNLSREPTVFRVGGLEKQLAVYLLSDNGCTGRHLVLKRRIDPPATGAARRAIYVKAVQEDGHIAWSSPMYVFP
jgi:hypothetical protein